MTRAKRLSFEMRKRALVEAAAAEGQPALVVEPVETPLWYVRHQTSFVESPKDDPGRVERLLVLASQVIKDSGQRAETLAEQESGSEAGDSSDS